VKHNHDADVNINVNIPKQDLEDLIDKVTSAVTTIIATVTVAYIAKSIFNPRSSS
jgi:hypothetical protein